jgi:4-amino-4-deoxy-L-arabinose transferase-like glycosyltransferase
MTLVRLSNALSVVLLVYVAASLVVAWRRRKADEKARMTLAYWASVGIAFLLAAAIVFAVLLVPS